MSGFKNLKDKEKEETKEKKGVPGQKPLKKGKVPATVTHDIVEEPKRRRGDQYFAEEIAPITGEFAGIVGDDGTCKTAIILNSIPKKDACVIIDFDGGGAALRDAFYGDRRSDFKSINPWVMQDESRTAYHYPATHDKVMEIGKEALIWARDQLEPDYKGQKLNTVLVTATDLWDSVSMACMFIEDLGTAPDGIGSKISPHEKVGMRFNWQIRSTRFHQLTSLCRELARLGVNVWYETHWQYEQRADGTATGAKKPKWEKQTSNYLHTIIEMKKTQIRNEEGFPTGETTYEATFSKARNLPEMLDKTRLVMSTYDDKPLKWHGLPELRG